MSASRIVLLRHGQTDFNIARRFQGRIDQPLNEAGRSQAAGAAGVLVSRLCEPSAEVGMIAAEDGRSYDDGGVRIVSSPLGRAVDTARIVARVFDIAGYPCEGPQLDDRLTERYYGTFEGKTYEEIADEQPEAYAHYRAYGECDLAEVERSEVVGERIRDAVLEAARECRAWLRDCSWHRLLAGTGSRCVQWPSRCGQLSLVGARARGHVDVEERGGERLATRIAQYRLARRHSGGVTVLGPVVAAEHQGFYVL